MFITLLVLPASTSPGEGFEVALPRVVDTLIGCAIAPGCGQLYLPDRAATFPGTPARAPPMLINCRYLSMRSLSNITDG